MKKSVKIILASVISFFVVVAIVLASVVYIIPNYQYQKAIALMTEENYQDAYDIFTDIHDFKDSNDYITKCEKTFVPAKVTGVKVNDCSTDKLTLCWEKLDDVSGYQIKMYNADTEQWDNYKEISENTDCLKIDSLIPGTVYDFKIVAINQFNDNKYYGEDSDRISVCTTPDSINMLSCKWDGTNIIEYGPNGEFWGSAAKIVAKWSEAKGNVDGYQLQIAYGTPDSPSVYETITIEEKSNTSFEFGAQDVVCARVRTYTIVDGEKVFGSWSSYKGE